MQRQTSRMRAECWENEADECRTGMRGVKALIQHEKKKDVPTE